MTNLSSGAPDAGPSRPSLLHDVFFGVLCASFFAVIAVGILVVAAIGTALGLFAVTDWSDIVPGLGFVFLGYFMAGGLGGVVFWFLRPLHKWLLGWMLTGFCIAALAYGFVGLTGTLAYYVGINLLDLKSAAEGWRLIPESSLVLGTVIGMPAGAYHWYKARREQRSRLTSA